MAVRCLAFDQTLEWRVVPLLRMEILMGYVLGMFAVVLALAVGLLTVFAIFDDRKAPRQGH